MITARGLDASRWSIEARRMLPACVALSLALHVLLLAIGSLRLAPSGQPAGAGRAAPGPISVRLMRDVPGADNPYPPAVARLPSLAPAVAIEQARQEPPPAASAPAQAQAAASAARDRPVQPATDPLAALAPSLRITDRYDYVPRPLLSVPPVTQAPIIIEAPADTGDVGRHVGVLALFINEQGRVDRIVAEPPPLPPAMERSAHAAFMAARFAPGQVDGQIVKSRLLVEVTFDSTPLAASGVRGPTTTIIESR